MEKETISNPEAEAAFPDAEGPIPSDLPFGDKAPQDPRQLPTDGNETIGEAFRQITEPKAPHKFALKKAILVGLCILVLAVILGTIGFFLISSAADPYDGLILSNVTVAGVDVGGMTRRDAEEAVRSVTDPLYSAGTMVVSLPDGAVKLSPDDTGVRLDVRGAVKAAYAYGRSGSREQRQADYNASLTGSYEVSLLPYVEADEDFIIESLNTYSEEHTSIYTPSSYALEGTMPELSLDKFKESAPCQTLMLTLGTPGGTLDAEAVTQKILSAYAAGEFTVRIDVVDENSLPAPLDLTRIHAELYIPPVDSTLDLQEFEVIPGSYGYTFDLALARELLDQAEYGDTVTVPMEYVRPQVMEDDVLFQDVLGTYATPHNTNENRNNNLRLACQTIDGLILMPGDEFSFNGTLGQRTAEKGYKPAPAYSGHELTNSYGGGICQVSSTLYSSCLLADMEILSRINHGFPPTYMDKGMDATVSWGGPDFQFRNSSHFPIKIHAETTDEEVRIEILGTDDRDYYIQVEVDVTGSSDAGVEYEEHAPGGQYRDGDVIRGGSPGYYVKTYRCKYDKKTDDLISREYEASSSYLGRPKVVASVKEPAPPTEEILPIEPPASSGAVPDPA